MTFNRMTSFIIIEKSINQLLVIDSKKKKLVSHITDFKLQLTVRYLNLQHSLELLKTLLIFNCFQLNSTSTFDTN